MNAPSPSNTVPVIHRLYRICFRYFRHGRLARLYRGLNIGPSTRLLDLGGDLFFWELAESMGMPVPQVTIVNLHANHRRSLPPGIRWVVGDGTCLPFRDHEFDVVFSNSVIEHLADEDSRLCFAREATRVGRSLFVQTPNRAFPIEPHLMAPFIHWMPIGLRRRLVRNFTVWGLVTRPTRATCRKVLDEIHLLNRRDMERLFPGAIVVKEKLLGVTKSLIATSPAPPEC